MKTIDTLQINGENYLLQPGRDPDVHAGYFDITNEGVLSLKPAYRGAAFSTYATKYPGGVSDQGVGVAGSLNSTVPEHIIIPEVVNEIAVTSLVPYMFGDNLAVKALTIPSFIKTIPDKFCEGAKNLREIHGGENVEVLGAGAFQLTGVRKAVFPKLKTIGDNVFKNNPMLVIADLGNEIVEIPKQTFYNCAKLSVLRNAENITAVDTAAFCLTRRLKTLPFLPKLETIGEEAFLCARVDCDWASLTGCTIGDNAVSTKWNPADFWSACTPTPCENPIKSAFNQRNPLWVNHTIGNTSLTYKSGCVLFSAAIVYSALADKELSSPMEFEDLLLRIDPTILDKGTEYFKDGADQWLEALGFTTEYHAGYTSESLQKAYDALADGAMVITSVITANNQGHASVLYGVNEVGEVMCVDPNWSGYIIGDYRVERFAMPIQNLVRPSDDFLIVWKK